MHFERYLNSDYKKLELVDGRTIRYQDKGGPEPNLENEIEELDFFDVEDEVVDQLVEETAPVAEI